MLYSGEFPTDSASFYLAAAQPASLRVACSSKQRYALLHRHRNGTVHVSTYFVHDIIRIKRLGTGDI